MCFGKEQITVFVTPETCESDTHHTHDNDAIAMESSCSADACDECTSHQDDCGCAVPEALFFKLHNQITNEEVRFTKVLPFELVVAELIVFTELWAENDSSSKEEFYSNPPPIVPTTIEFLVQIQQLKIPHIA